MTAEEQLDEVRKNIRKYATIDLKVLELNQLSKLSNLAALTVVSLALENGDAIFDNWLSEEHEFFNNFVKNEICEQNVNGMKWDDLILRVEWKWALYQDMQSSKFDQTIKNFVMKMSAEYPEQFNIQSINRLGTVPVIEADFVAMIIRDDDFKERYSPNRAERLKELFDDQLEKNIELHPGFQKSCGLRGSKLSYG